MIGSVPWRSASRVSPRFSSTKARRNCVLDFLPRSPHESRILLATPNRSGLQHVVPAFDLLFLPFLPQCPDERAGSPCPTMPSADFCDAVRSPHGSLSPEFETRRRPPEVSSTAFTAHLPDLQPCALDGYGLCDQLPARPTKDASYPISVRQVAALLHASFRPHLTMTPLRFANPSPPSGWIGTFTPKLLNMLGTQLNRSRGRALRAEQSSGEDRAQQLIDRR